MACTTPCICIFAMAEEKSIDTARCILRILMEKNLARCRQPQGQIGRMRSGRVSSLPHGDPVLRPGLLGRVRARRQIAWICYILRHERRHFGLVPTRPATGRQPRTGGRCSAQRACPADIHLGARGRRRLAAWRCEPLVAASIPAITRRRSAAPGGASRPPPRPVTRCIALAGPRKRRGCCLLESPLRTGVARAGFVCPKGSAVRRAECQDL